MIRYVLLCFSAALVGCAGPGWQHEPLDYSTLIRKPIERDFRVEIEIVETVDTATQTMVYAGVGFYGERSWEYDQYVFLEQLATETEAALNKENDVERAVRLRVSGEMLIDRRGDYTATLVGEVLCNDGVVQMREVASGFVESKVASAVAFENAYKIAFSNLLKALSFVQQP